MVPSSLASLLALALALAAPGLAQPGRECPRVTREHTACLDRWGPWSSSTPRAYKSYTSAVEAGEDGEPNFHARKACDYLKNAVEVVVMDGGHGSGHHGRGHGHDGGHDGSHGGHGGQGSTKLLSLLSEII